MPVLINYSDQIRISFYSYSGIDILWMKSKPLSAYFDSLTNAPIAVPAFKKCLVMINSFFFNEKAVRT